MPSPAELKSVTTTHVLHWKKKKIQCGCTCVYELLIAFLIGVANLLLEVSPELPYGAGPNCGVW
jgi:hypothetical protein